MAVVAVSVLGRTTVRDTHGTTIDITRDAQRRLLAIMVCADGQWLATDTLIDRFWRSDPPASAKGALHTHLSALRRALPDGVIVTEGSGYRIDRELVDVDAWRLGAIADQVATARRAGDRECVVARCIDAWSLDRGIAYEDLLDDGFASAARATVDAHRAALDEAGIDALVALERFGEALPHAERATVERPLDERAWELLARARAGAGRIGEALRAVHGARRALAEAGLEPGPALRAVERELLAGGDDRTTRHNLVARPSSFIGRSDELRDLGQRLAVHRTLTLVGVGGTGKSRLAHEVARRSIDGGSFDAIWFVELAAERDPEQIAARVAAASSLRADDGDRATPTESVIRSIGDRATLLVLDNCEHLAAGVAPFVRAVVERCPRVRVLATSRVPLGVSGELIVAVPPLALGDEPSGAPSDAIALFVDRARLADPDLVLSADDLCSVAAMCRSLDGLPLAIELVASQLWSADLHDLERRLDDRLDTLVAPPGARPDRQRTVRSALAWSVDRLDAADRQLFASLAVFRGRVDAVAVADVCGLELTEAAQRLAALATAALLEHADVGGYSAFRMLEVVRDFAAELLDDDARATLIGRHHDHYRRRAAELRLLWMQPPERRAQAITRRWWDDLAISIDDVRSAHANGGGNDLDDLIGLLAHVAAAEGRHRDAIALLEQSVVTGSPDAELDAVARSLLASELALADQPRRAVHHMNEARRLVDDLPASFAKVLVLARAGILSMAVPQLNAADGLEPALAGLAAAEQLAPFARWRLEALVATLSARCGRTDDAMHHLDRLVAAASDTNDPGLRATMVTAALNVHAIARRDRHAVDPWIEQALEIIAEHPSAAQSDLGAWTFWCLSQLGRYDEAGNVLDLVAPVEGYEVVGTQAMRARLAWLRGESRSAADLVDQVIETGGDLYWEPNLCATGAEAHADLGQLEAVHRYAERLLFRPDVPDDAALAATVLGPLIRAEVDRALADDGTSREVHAARARADLERLRAIGATARPDATTAVVLEPWQVQLAMAEAEVARLGPAADELAAWSAVAERLTTERYRRHVAQRRDAARARLS